MRADDLYEGPRDDIAAFAADFNSPKINTSVQQQAARKNPAWKKSLIKTLAKYGFTLVGAGVNGAVFQHPGYAYVLKVYREDKMFDEWLHFVRTHSRNPHVPQIKGQTIRLNSVFSAVRMEPLSPCDPTAANSFIEPIEIAIDSYNDVLKLKANNPFLGEIAAFMREWQQVSDLTAHNMMQRADGTLVITDPLYLQPGQVLDW